MTTTTPHGLQPDELTIARREVSLYFQKLTASKERLAKLRARHQRQNKIVAAARAVIDAWDENDWQEHAGDGELADAIASLRKTMKGRP